MQRRNAVGAALCALVLASCSGGEPSASDMREAVEWQIDLLSAFGVETTIDKFEKHRCTEAGEGRYRCTFTVTATTSGVQQSIDDSQLFEEMGDRWRTVTN